MVRLWLGTEILWSLLQDIQMYYKHIISLMSNSEATEKTTDADRLIFKPRLPLKLELSILFVVVVCPNK